MAQGMVQHTDDQSQVWYNSAIQASQVELEFKYLHNA